MNRHCSLFFAFLIFSTVTGVSFAQDISAGLILEGSAGYGATTFGLSTPGSDEADLGSGAGAGFDISAMADLSIFAVKFGYSYATLNTLEFTSSNSGINTSYNSYGDGHYTTFDAQLGFKLFTEDEDMGYTFFYGGYRSWSALRNIDYYTANGIKYSPALNKFDISGKGWNAGYQDVSTFPVNGFSIVFQNGLNIYSAPISKMKINGYSYTAQDVLSMGIGLNLGLGFALEDMGLSVLGGYKLDVTLSEFTFSEITDDSDIFGAGYSLFFISATKDLRF